MLVWMALWLVGLMVSIVVLTARSCSSVGMDGIMVGWSNGNYC